MTTASVPPNASTGPYARGAQIYLDRGWVAPLPCDHRLGRVPTGFTGYTTAVPTQADVNLWITSRGDANLGLRMQDGTLGIDVDCHDGKRGCEILELAEQMNGVLPPTWYSTARDDGSRHLMFRVPKGMEWKSEIVEKSIVDDKGKPARGIEILRPHHRWSRTWPSLNERTGQPIHWYTPEGVVSAVPPRPEDLAELPAEWVEYLRGKTKAEKATLEFTDEKFDWEQFAVEDDSIPEGDQNWLLFRALSSIRAGSRDGLLFAAAQLVKKFEGNPNHPKGDWDAKSITGVVDQVMKYEPGTSVVIDPNVKLWAQQVDAPLLDGWLDVTELDQLVAPSYLVKGLLDRPVVALLHGDGGVGKSFMSLDIAAHVALGRQWRGQRVRQTRVAYVYAESPSFASRRVAAWCHVNQTPLEELRGKLVVYPKALDLLGASEPLEALASWLEKAGVGLIVVDTLRRNMAGGDENSQKDTSRALAWGTRFTQSNATCLVIHHDNKGGSYSGSTAMHGHVDTRLHLTRDERDSTVMRLEADKQREMADNGALFGRLESVQLGTDDDGDPIYSAAFVEADEPEKLVTDNELTRRVKANENTVRVVSIVEQLGPVGLNHIVREWVARHGKVGKMTVNDALNCALDDGSITRNDAKLYLRSSGQTAG